MPDEPRPHYDLADDCHEIGLKFPHGNEVRQLLLECRHRIVTDAKTLHDLREALREINRLSTPQ